MMVAISYFLNSIALHFFIILIICILPSKTADAGIAKMLKNIDGLTCADVLRATSNSPDKFSLFVLFADLHVNNKSPDDKVMPNFNYVNSQIRAHCKNNHEKKFLSAFKKISGGVDAAIEQLKNRSIPKAPPDTTIDQEGSIYIKVESNSILGNIDLDRYSVKIRRTNKMSGASGYGYEDEKTGSGSFLGEPTTFHYKPYGYYEVDVSGYDKYSKQVFRIKWGNIKHACSPTEITLSANDRADPYVWCPLD